MNADDDALLAEVRRLQAEYSATIHDLLRRQRLLIRAGTRLRLGVSSAVVLAEIHEREPALLAGWTAPRNEVPAQPV